MTPQDLTKQTYQNNFDIYKAKTSSVMSGEFVAWMDAFVELLPPEGKVFELGSAEGRDARYLREKGLSVFCTDIIPQAVESLKQDGFDASIYDFRDASQEEWKNSFDGVLAKAVYLHATTEIFEQSLSNLSQIVKSGGIFCITFKLGKGEEIETEKLGSERYFKYYQEEELLQVIKKFPQLEVVEVMKTSDEKWIQLLLRKLE